RLPEADAVAGENRDATGLVQLLAVQQLVDPGAVRVEGGSGVRANLERLAEGVQAGAHHDQLVSFAGTAAVGLRARVEIEAEDGGVGGGRVGQATHGRAEKRLVWAELGRRGEGHGPMVCKPGAVRYGLKSQTNVKPRR